MIYQRADDILHDRVFLQLDDFIPQTAIHLKLECFNLGNSIKLKPARALVDDAERNRGLKQKRKIIESSSGNLGLALSVICSSRNYHFTCVADANTLPQNIKAMEVYGTDVVVITQKDANGGYLDNRLTFIREAMAKDPDLIWLDQYRNLNNPKTHAQLTATSILEQFGHVDYLFIGSGTTGTLMGCAEHFKKVSPHTKIIAVDAVGSVIFGTPAGPRYIPGLGSSVGAPLLNHHLVDDLVHVPEINTIKACRRLAQQYGYLGGGSTGTVLAAIVAYQQHIAPDSVVVAISPDAGERYIDTIYNDQWCQTHFNQHF